mmetsp:Transcript_13033/g.41187  ORF Transcript_13033/g.41187 Transcript_13033/m.41187 type:complete len:247 (+) Transcript_13033:620-1360(+)
MSPASAPSPPGAKYDTSVAWRRSNTWSRERCITAIAASHSQMSWRYMAKARRVKRPTRDAATRIRPLMSPAPTRPVSCPSRGTATSRHPTATSVAAHAAATLGHSTYLRRSRKPRGGASSPPHAAGAAGAVAPSAAAAAGAGRRRLPPRALRRGARRRPPAGREAKGGRHGRRPGPPALAAAAAEERRSRSCCRGPTVGARRAAASTPGIGGYVRRGGTRPYLVGAPSFACLAHTMRRPFGGVPGA